MNEKIVARINKLMALTQSSNENESAKAAEMAFKLMEENGITASDLKSASLEEELGTISNENLKYKSWLCTWEKNLAYVIARYFNCCTYTSSKPHPTKDWKIYSVGFVGHEANRITAITMYEWLRKAIQREAGKKFSSYSYQQSYCLGVVLGLSERYGKESNVDSTETGLVIYDDVKNWMKDNMTLGQAKSRAVSIYSSVYAAGKADSSKYSLNRQVGLKRIGC